MVVKNSYDEIIGIKDERDYYFRVFRM